MRYDKEEEFLTMCALEEAEIFFHPADFLPEVEEVKKTVNALVYAGKCTGANLERLVSGEIRLFFNPMVHTMANRHEAIEAVEEAVRKGSMATTIARAEKLL